MGLFLFVVRVESHFMNDNQYSSDKSLQDFYKRVSSKISTGFIVKREMINYLLRFYLEKLGELITALTLYCFV